MDKSKAIELIYKIRALADDSQAMEGERKAAEHKIGIIMQRFNIAESDINGFHRSETPDVDDPREREYPGKSTHYEDSAAYGEFFRRFVYGSWEDFENSDVEDFFNKYSEKPHGKDAIRTLRVALNIFKNIL